MAVFSSCERKEGERTGHSREGKEGVCAKKAPERKYENTFSEDKNGKCNAVYRCVHGKGKRLDAAALRGVPIGV